MTDVPFIRLAPMPRNFEATVPIQNLWRTAVELIDAAANVEAVVRELTGYEMVKLPQHHGSILGIAAAVSLQTCIEEDLLSVYVEDGSRFRRLPHEAFVHQFKAGDGSLTRLASRSVEHSFALGRLDEYDIGDEQFRAFCGLPLLTETSDAEATLHWLKARLVPESNPQLKRRLSPRPQDSAGFLRWAEQQPLRPTIADCVEWGNRNGFSREWVRKQRDSWPPELKNRVGERKGLNVK